MTEKYYFVDAFCSEITAIIVDLDYVSSSVILDKTIFHVKGGGQLADSGTINDSIVLNVTHAEDGKILHHIAKEDLNKFLVNSPVFIKINSGKRKFHSRLHSAGHLIAGLVEKFYPELKAISGNHIPDQCRIVFSGELLTEIGKFTSELEAKLNATIQLNNPVVSKEGKNNLRFINIMDCHESACGGTHVSALAEIGEIVIRKVSMKNKQVAIGYEIR